MDNWNQDYEDEFSEVVCPQCGEKMIWIDDNPTYACPNCTRVELPDGRLVAFNKALEPENRFPIPRGPLYENDCAITNALWMVDGELMWPGGMKP